MLLQQMLHGHTYRNDEPGSEGAGGGGGGSQSVDLNAPEVQKAIQDAVARETAGLKANRDEILDEKRRIREEFDGFKKSWEGLDAESVRTLMQRFENDEEAKLLAEGKVDEVIAKRTEAARRDAESRVEAAQKALTERDEALAGANAKIAELTIDAAVRSVAVDAGVHKSSLPDIVGRARTVFGLGDDYEVVAKGPDGSKLYGKDGKSPLSPSEWLESMKREAPHWWPPSAGGGAGGGTGRNDASGTQDLDKMSSRELLKTGLRGRSDAA